MFPEIKLAQQIIWSCKAKNIKHIVISPGSRNAPLTIGFNADPFFKCYSIVDERAAGFFALGIAQQLSEPVAVVCTSGSALLNYYPSVSEAFYSNIPLVVISADRPESKIDIGDGQTIRQRQVFSNHTIYDANLVEGDHQLKFNEGELNKALNLAKETHLPVHINAPFEEPLYQTTSEVVPFENISFEAKKETICLKSQEEFVQKWNTSSKKMVLVGILKPNSVERAWVDFLKNDPSVLVLTETLSNISESSHIQMIDSFLVKIEENPEKRQDLQPEMLISLGGMVVSKKIKDFLRKNQPKYHYHIDNFVGYDTFFCLNHHFKEDFNDFFSRNYQNLHQVSSNYKENWLSFYDEILKRREEFLKEIPYSDFLVYKKIFEMLPENIHLQISNSSPIRYGQLFSVKNGWEVFCNRGTSGIDGSTSTAIGASVINPKPTIFITGDLSFFYNSNALWCKDIPKNFKILLINNDGGGIFRILPGDKNLKCFEPFFETPHGLSAEYLAKMYQFSYQKAENEEELTQKLQDFLFLEEDSPKILEIFTPRQKNDEVLKQYFNFLIS